MTITDCPYQFFLVCFVATLMVGITIGCLFSKGRIRRLQQKLDFKRLGL